jgi:hypothetical protein
MIKRDFVRTREIIKLDNVRLSFPSVWQKRVWQGAKNDPKFEATFILDKDKNAKEIAKIKDEIDYLLKANNLKVISKKNHFFKDGDAEIDGIEKKEEYKNSYTVKTSSYTKISIINKDKTPIVESDDLIYGGCYVNAWIEIKPYRNLEQGVNASIKIIQYRSAGERFGGGLSVSFDEIPFIEDEQDDEDF